LATLLDLVNNVNPYQATLFCLFSLSLAVFHYFYPHPITSFRLELGIFAPLAIAGFAIFGFSFIFQIFKLSARYAWAQKVDFFLKISGEVMILLSYLLTYLSVLTDLSTPYLWLISLIIVPVIFTAVFFMYAGIVVIKPDHLGYKERRGRPIDVLNSGVYFVVPLLDQIEERDGNSPPPIRFKSLTQHIFKEED